MSSRSHTQLAVQLGDESPLSAAMGRRPDRRRVSSRWMAGSVLTGLTSVLLMGGALYAALDGRQQLTTPANVLDGLTSRLDDSGTLKGDRPISVVSVEPTREKILQVPTVQRSAEGDVIRKKPFAYAAAPLAVAPTRQTSYPAFDPLTVFSASSRDQITGSSDVIYSADIEGEVKIRTDDFPLDAGLFDKTHDINDRQAALAAAEAIANLDADGLQLAALPYLDTSRFELSDADIIPISTLSMTKVAENVSRIPLEEGDLTPRYTEEVVVVTQDRSIEATINGLNEADEANPAFAQALVQQTGADDVKRSTRMRLAWDRGVEGDTPRLQRVSLYYGGDHLATAAKDDSGAIVAAVEPTPIEATAGNEDGEAIVTTVARGNLPTVYDGIYRAALSQGLTKNHARRIVRTVAFDVDFRTRIDPKDELEVFYSVEDGADGATSESEILYVGLTLKGKKRRYYRFKADAKGAIDFYGADGKSAKKFLLRKPVPQGKFRSPFGPRRHPISRRVKMHNGVDFSAPRGTPILAAGNGVVEKAGWAGGYGRQTIIRHANGYKTSYNHQHRFAKGIKPGARVRQGQIIGQVGSTGYSTGPHLHYEVIVNKRKVNPMKIRLPQGRVLTGRKLANFLREKARIDALLDRSRNGETTLASL